MGKYDKNSVACLPLATVIHKCTIVTARVRSTREGNVFSSVCLSVHGGGGVLQSGSRKGIPPFPWPGPGQGYLPPARTMTGVPPLQPTRATDRIRRGQYASCGRGGGLSCVLHVYCEYFDVNGKYVHKQ